MKYDIAIVGGGMVGASLALALSDTSHSIALLDSAASLAEDHRLIALNHASVQFFKKIGILPPLGLKASEIREVHVSTRGSFGVMRLHAREMEVDYLGCVVPAREINQALYEKLAAQKNIHLYQNTKLTALSQKPSEAELTLELNSEPKKMSATIVVGADGTFSTVRTCLNIPTEMIDYHQKALVTVTALNRDHHHIAYERFLSNGAIAMLPLPNQRVATIWSGNENTIDQLLKLSDADFLDILQKQFGYRLGKLIHTEKRVFYPLKFIRAKEQIQGRVILIGNAAHTVHPVAAQGLNLALYEVQILSNHFRQHALSLENLPDFSIQKNISLQLSHRLTQLFSMDFFVTAAARQMGMMGLDLCTPLKKRLGKYLLGQVRPE